MRFTKKKMKKPLFLFFLSLFFFSSFSQEIWTLESCIIRAQEENLDIKQAKLSVLSSQQQLKQSKLSLLPSLNTGAAQAYNYGRTVDPYSNEFTNVNIKTNNLSLSSSITLFNGFQNINKVKRDNYEYMAKKHDVEKVINDISLAVATDFLQVLFNKELVAVADKQLEISIQQEERISKLVSVGQLPRSALLETQSQVASEQLQLVRAKNQRDIALLGIKQLLEIESNTNFDIVVPSIELPKKK